MEREISDVVHMGIAMACIAAVLTLVVPNLWLGRQLASRYLSYTENINANLTDGELEYLKDRSIEIPAAGVFELVKANESYVNKMYLTYDGLYGTVNATSNGDIIDPTTSRKTDVYKKFEKNMNGKVKLYVVWNSAENGYDFHVHALRCSGDLTHLDNCSNHY